MSPGEYATRGQGLTIRYGWHASPFSPMLLMTTGRGVCGVAFAAEIGIEPALQDMINRWPNAQFVDDAKATEPAASDLLLGADPTHLHLIGAPFQIKVWEALLAVPTGHVTTYSAIAEHIGNPKAVRAVGTAVGRNPISWLIPCHRALRKSGGLGRYHWGLPVKRALLAWESARAEVENTQNVKISL
jgi:AraC family transcriptional regulator of adaptative response/methylated-DNA-[protein]-cysteine methyltransferase